MSSTASHRFNGAQGAGKHLPLTRNFYSRLDDITDAGDSHSITRMDDGEGDRLDARILKRQLFQFLLVDVEGSCVITKGSPQSHLRNRKLSQLQTHMRVYTNRAGSVQAI
jgi:hypothetical protein